MFRLLSYHSHSVHSDIVAYFSLPFLMYTTSVFYSFFFILLLPVLLHVHDFSWLLNGLKPCIMSICHVYLSLHTYTFMFSKKPPSWILWRLFHVFFYLNRTGGVSSDNPLKKKPCSLRPSTTSGNASTVVVLRAASCIRITAVFWYFA